MVSITAKTYMEVVLDTDLHLVMEVVPDTDLHLVMEVVHSTGDLVVVPMLDHFKFNCRSINFPNE